MAGIGSLKGPAHELQREFLENLVGRILATERSQQVAADRPAVAFQQRLLGLPGLFRAAVVRLPDNRPQCLDPAEPQIILIHRFSS